MVHLEGRLYAHNLEKKVTGENSKNPNTPYVAGTIDVETAPQNVVSVHYTYVTPTYSASGKTNPNYQVLYDIADGKIVTLTTPNVDNNKAPWVRIDSNIDLNEFYTDRDGEETLVSVKRNEGGFLHIIREQEVNAARANEFRVDMVITGVTHVDGDPDKGTTDRAVVKGGIFNFRNALLPVEFSVTSNGGMNYFEGLGASKNAPVFTQVWGNEVATTITRKIEEESAFGEAYVREVNSTRRDFIITGTKKEPYEWDDESTITAAELSKAMTDRQTYLATIKQRQDEYRASQAAAPSTPKNGAFNF